MLFLKECKKTICSLTFVLYAVVIFAMYISQFTPELNSPLRQPSPEDGDYRNVDGSYQVRIESIHRI